MRASAPLSCVLLLTSAVALAESGPFNIHVEPAATLPLPETGSLGAGGAMALKLDVALTNLLAIQAQGFTMTAPRSVRLTPIYGAGLGVRVRLLNDHGGFRFRPKGSTKGGNWFGNLWFDGGLLLTGVSAINRFGLDAGVGMELSLFEGLQTGPFVKFTYADGLPIPSVGISISLGADAEEEGPADLDKDGILDPSDRCVNQPEDKDNFKDEDGCPDPDNDGDNLIDDRDKCPLQAEDLDGVDDEDGCPEETPKPVETQKEEEPPKAEEAPKSDVEPEEAPATVPPPTP